MGYSTPMKKRNAVLIIIIVLLGVGFGLSRLLLVSDDMDTGDYSEDMTEEIMRAIGYVQQ
mgnify:CR=1 FL=1